MTGTLEYIKLARFDTVRGYGGHAPLLKRDTKTVLLTYNPDIVFTVGNTATSVAQEMLASLGRTTPIVMVATLKPAQDNIVPHDPDAAGTICSGNNVTGFSVPVSTYHERLALVISCIQRPITRILLLHSSTKDLGVKDEIDSLTGALQALDIEVVDHIFDDDNRIHLEQLAHHGFDMILLPRDGLVMDYIHDIIKLSRASKIPLLTSDGLSARLGATMSFGVSEHLIGEKAALWGRQVVAEKRDPSVVTMKMVMETEWGEREHLTYNRAAAAKQGILFNYEKLTSYQIPIELI